MSGGEEQGKDVKDSKSVNDTCSKGVFFKIVHSKSRQVVFLGEQDTAVLELIGYEMRAS